MLGRGSTITGDRGADIASDVGARAAEAMSELADLAGRAAEKAAEAAKTYEPVIRSAAEKAAERAGEAAREARKNAEPVIRSAAEKAAANLSDAAEKAAEVLAETAERLAQQGAEKTAEAGTAAGRKLAKASAKLARQTKARKSHKVRNVLLVGGAIGGGVALAMSPVGARIKEKITGQAASEQDEPQSITLPVNPPATATPPPTAEKAKSSGEGNGVLAGRPVPPGEEASQGS